MRAEVWWTASNGALEAAMQKGLREA
jgi:hypothetical protein